MKKRTVALMTMGVMIMMLMAFGLAEEAADPFPGTWQDPVYGRAVLEIEKAGEGYALQITWGNSADSNGIWHMNAAREGDSLVYENGTLSVVTYGEGGAIVNEELLYDDASGAFTLTDEGKLLWSDSREDRAPEFAYERTGPSEGQREFASLTGIDVLREKLYGGVTIDRVCYTDGYGFSTSEFTTVDSWEIEVLWEALNAIEIVGRVDEDITDWYPQIVFYLSDGASFGVRFDAHWLEIGGMEHYALANDEDFWNVTSHLVEQYAGAKD